MRPLGNCPQGQGAEQSWKVFKGFHRAQELVISRHKKSGNKGRNLTWLRWDLLAKLEGRKEMHRQWKQEEVSWEKYRETAQLCRDGSRKAKAGAELGKGRTE